MLLDRYAPPMLHSSTMDFLVNYALCTCTYSNGVPYKPNRVSVGTRCNVHPAECGEALPG